MSNNFQKGARYFYHAMAILNYYKSICTTKFVITYIKNIDNWNKQFKLILQSYLSIYSA